jgi:hypothetical protein
MEGMNKNKTDNIVFQETTCPTRTPAPSIVHCIIKGPLNSTYIHGLLQS